MNRILVTGGAGFIGSHIVDALVEQGHQVRVFDKLAAQVHGVEAGRPAYLHSEAEFIIGDVCDRDALRQALQGIEIIFHEAAEVGVGQSMYEIGRYVEANTYGTAILLDLLVNETHSVRKLIVASSMSIYGEGAYRCAGCGPVYPQLRSAKQLAARDWEMRCPRCRAIVKTMATNEEKPLYPTSIYAISKMDQELMCLNVGRAYGIPTVALRYFNTYGRRQALSNPYTGVAAIFSSRLLNGNQPLIFEDGLQSRDFIHVTDIVQANLLGMENDAADFQVFNIGTGRRLTISDVAHTLAQDLGLEIKPEFVEQFRVGDIRHCYADISKARDLLGFEPRTRFEDGMADLVNWIRQQDSVDWVEQAKAELDERGLAR